MYKCDHCNKEFEEPKAIHTTYEMFYGVSRMFENHHDLNYDACPYCESIDIFAINDLDFLEDEEE